MKHFIFLFLFCLVCIGSRAQTYLDVETKQSIRNHALDNIKELENVLNEIVSSNNSEEKKILIFNCKQTVIDGSANIEDDLNPDKSTTETSDFISVDAYLERLPLVFIPDNSLKLITFSKIYVSNVHTDEYTYVSICFESLYAGSHKVTNKKYKKVLRVATVKLIPSETKIITKIVSIKFSNSTQCSNIQKESAKCDLEFNELKESTTYKQKLAEQEYSFYIKEADADFTKKDYTLAKVRYSKALHAKPDDKYAANKIEECENNLVQMELDYHFKQLIREGDDEFSLKRYYIAKSKFEAAQRLRSDDTYVKYMLSRIERKINPKYPNRTTAYVGVNYSFSETPIKWSTNFNTFEDGLKNDVSLERFGISFYYPIGFYVSGIKTWEEKEPDYHYSFEAVNSARNNLINSNSDYTDLTFVRKGDHTGAFNLGIYLSFFRPLYFKFGIKQRFGSQWDLFSGDFKGKINYANKTNLYAVNYKSTNHSDFQAGFAIVVPYGQIEATYDNFNQSIQISAGVNYPFRNVYFLKNNPTKWKKEKSSRSDADRHFPYRKTFYVALSYDFLNYYPDLYNEFEFENLTDGSFSEPLSEKFSLSLYYKFGFYISGFKRTKDNVPDYHYSSTDVAQKRNILVSSQTPFTELTYISTQGNYTKFNLGMSLSFFRPLHLKFGASFAIGSIWDVYSGDYKEYMIKFNKTDYYALDYKEYINSKFVGGIAIVFPYAQFEIMYDGFYNMYSLSAGLNIPIVKK